MYVGGRTKTIAKNKFIILGLEDLKDNATADRSDPACCELL
jgi:hypothetical protein